MAKVARRRRLQKRPSPAPKPDRWARLFAALDVTALAWGIVGAAACMAMVPFEVSLLEEGVSVHVAQRLAHGERLYQDVLLFTGPLPFEALAVLFRIFGEGILVGRLAIVILHALATAATYAIARRGGAGPFAHAAAAATACTPPLLFPNFHIFFYNTIAVSLSSLATYAALRGIHSWRWAVVGGLLVACVALCKQSIGVVLGVSLGVALWTCAGKGRRTPISLAFVSGGAGVAALTLGLFAAQGGIEGLLRALVVLPLSLEQAYNSPFMNFWPPGQFAPEIKKNQIFYLPYTYYLGPGSSASPTKGFVLFTQALYLLPFAALATTALRRARGPLPTAAWLHGALLVTWTSNLFPRTDWGHLAHVLPFATTQLFLFRQPRDSETRRAVVAARIATGALVVATGTAAVWAGMLILQSADPNGLSTRVPFRPVNLGVQGRAVRGVIEYLGRHASPGEPIFVPRAEPLLYYATGTSNPTPFSGVIPAMRQEQEATILEGLERVRYVVMSDIDGAAMTYYSKQLPSVQRYLERHFRIPHDFSGWDRQWLVLLERVEDRGETVVDLVDQANEARPWVRNSPDHIEPADHFTETLATRQNHRPLGFHVGWFGGGLDFDVGIPEVAVFQAAVGLWAVGGDQNFYEQPRNALLRVSIGEAGTFTLLAETLAPVRSGEWIPFETDLAAYAGRRVTLRLELAPKRGHLSGRMPMIGYFGSPRIALRPRVASNGTRRLLTTSP